MEKRPITSEGGPPGWLRFSLKSLLLFTLLVAAFLGGWASQQPKLKELRLEVAYADTSTESLMLVTDADDAYDELGLGPHDFDIVFAYPWPGEECLIEGLFEKYAAEEALLMTYNQYNSVRLRRKVGEMPGSS